MNLKMLLPAVILVLQGCTSMGKLDSTTPIDLSQESIFVIGVAPRNFRISVFPGRVEAGAFVQSNWRSAAVFGSADAGYVIGKAKPGDVLAITGIQWAEDENRLGGANFGPCEGQKTMVFTMPAGKGVYLIDIRYDYVGSGLTMDIRSDIDAAQAHVDKFLPQFKGRLEQIDFRMLPVNRSCITTIYY